MKKYIIGFIVGILVSSIGVYAITASEIDYKDTKLDQALNNIYSNLDSKIVLNTFGTPQVDELLTTTASTSGNVNVSLTKGKYLMLVSYNRAWVSTSKYNESFGSSRNVTCQSNNCVITNLTAKAYNKSGTTKRDTIYVVTQTKAELYYIDVKEDNDTIVLPYTSGGSLNSSVYPQVIYAQTIKLN